MSKLLYTGILLIIAGICGINVSSLATECYDQNQEFKENKKSNFNFILVFIAFNILFILSGAFSVYFGIKEKQLVV